MSEGLEAPGTEAPATLAAAVALAALFARPVRVAGAEPVAAVVLIEIESKGLE